MSKPTCNTCWSTSCMHPGEDRPGCLVLEERAVLVPPPAEPPAKLERRKVEVGPYWFDRPLSPDVRHWLTVAGLLLALVALCFLAPVVVP